MSPCFVKITCVKKPASSTDFVVETPTYHSNYRRLEPDLLLMERLSEVPEPRRETDVFGKAWSLALADLPDGQVAVRRLGQRIPLTGRRAVFLPPFNIIEWDLGEGSFRWDALISTAPLPSEAPREPVAFDWDWPGVPQTLEEVFTRLVTPRPSFEISKIEEPHPLAMKAKELIDRSFMDSTGIEELAATLGCSHAAMTRLFTRCYGIPPVAYRNKQRVLEAMNLLVMKGMNVTDSGFKVGFEDASTFYRQFTRTTRCAPSNYVVHRSRESTKVRR
jgi:AraC-like DNA-binding protein